jgi:trimeric autotransporter adhesin
MGFLAASGYTVGNLVNQHVRFTESGEFLTYPKPTGGNSLDRLIERKQMSTKTTFKRIALVAVAALGLGVLTSIAPASAARVGADTTATVTAITGGTAAAVRPGQAVYVPITVTASHTASTTVNLRAVGVSAPTGSAFLTATTGKSFTFGASTTAPNAGAISKWYPTGPNAATAGATLAAGDTESAAAAGTSATTVLDTAAIGTSVQLYFTFTADVAGTYSFIVYNEANDNSTLGAGEISSSLISVTTSGAPATAVITTLNTGVAQASGISTGNAAATIELLDAAGVRTTLSSSEVVTLSSSSTAMTFDGAATQNLVAADFAAGTPGSGLALVKMSSATAATYVATLTFGGALPTYTTTKSVTFTATTASAATGTGLDSTSAYVISGPAAGGFIDATSTASQKITSAPALTGATGDALYVIPAGAFTWTLTDTATADAAIKIAVEVTEIGGSISGVPGGAAVYTIPVTLTAGVGTFTITSTSTAASSTTGFVGYTVKVLSTGAPVYFGASIGAGLAGAGTVTSSPTTYAAVAGGAIAVSYTVEDGFGNAVVGASVVGSVTGRNTRTLVGTTGADGVAILTYTDAGTTATATSDTIAITATYYVGTSMKQPTTSTTVSYSANNAVATAVMTSGNTAAGVAALAVAPKDIAAGLAGPSAVTQPVTVLVKNAAGQTLAGVPVTFTVAGTGCAIPSTVKTAYTVAGVATSAVYAWIAGTCTITATAGTITATGTTTFRQETPAEVRTISATAAGSVVTATPKDRFGNVVVGDTVYAIITAGNGYFGSNGSRSTSAVTDSTGSATFVVAGGDATVKVTTIDPAGTGLANDQSTAALDKHLGDVTTPVAFTATTAGDLATAETGVGATFAPAGISSVTVEVTGDNSAQAAADAAAEATDAANAATDAANAAAEAADAATAAAQDAADAVAALATQVSEMVDALKKQITALTNLVIKIQRKVRA